MSTQTITAPDLGVEQAQVIEIMASVGDSVTADDNIVLVESDKASVEVPAGQAGTITEILVANGDTIKQGSELIKLDTSVNSASNDDASTAQETQKETAKASVAELAQQATATDNTQATTSSTATSTKTFTIPDLGVDKAEVIEVMANVGDVVAANDNIVLLESDKASMEVPSPAAGEIVAIHLAVGDSASAGADFITLKVAGADASASASNEVATEKTTDVPLQAKTANTSATPTQQTQNNAQNSNQSSVQRYAGAKKVYAGPSVRKLCRELGVDITQVAGTAVNGRIIKDDVHAYVKNQLNNKADSVSPQGSAVASALPPLPDMSGEEWGATHEEPLTNLQKVSIPQLTYNTLIPQVTQFDLADITDTESYRQSVKDGLKKEGVSLTIVAFAIKAVAYALTKYPKFNSHLSDDHTKLIMRDEVHIGMAVSTDHGLIVPVVRHADQKGLVQIATELKELATKARDKKLGMKALTGAGFSISSQGNMGGTYFTPLVNVPQVAILGISEATIQPRWNASKNEFEPRLMLPLSLSYDHRVINGADAAVFTRYLAHLLGDVRKILL